jgi:hypothetical protein
MTDQPGKDGAVNRLLDMVVEEVSLVDRAANNRQFLIVKRDQSMDEDTDTEKADASADEEPDEVVADGSPLSAAIAALESLTSIVEVLGSLGANRADTRLAELARELRDTADQILTSVDESDEEQTADATDNTSGEGAETADALSGVELRAKAKAKPAKPPPKAPRKPPTKGPKEPPGKDAQASELDDEEEPDEEAAAKTAKSALAKLAKLLEGLTASSGDTPRTAPSTPNEKGADLAATIKRLADSVQTLTQTIQEQHQRLGRVEKQFGLPNSASEPTAKSADETIGWPLDLNHPMDRQSVDKAVSFHD